MFCNRRVKPQLEETCEAECTDMMWKHDATIQQFFRQKTCVYFWRWDTMEFRCLEYVMFFGSSLMWSSSLKPWKFEQTVSKIGSNFFHESFDISIFTVISVFGADAQHCFPSNSWAPPRWLNEVVSIFVATFSPLFGENPFWKMFFKWMKKWQWWRRWHWRQGWQ